MLCKRCKADKPRDSMEAKTNYNICQSCIKGTSYIGRVNRVNGIKISEARKVVLKFYGAFCGCCGEDEESFLDIDHVFNDGADHRREIKKDLCVWIVQNNFPNPERYQVLCSNCNQGKRRAGGICPHERYRIRLAS